MTKQYNNTNVVRSINDNQENIILDIINLYCQNGIECDPTYSKGVFYKNKIQKPTHCFDIAPQSSDVIQADCRKLPLEDDSIGSIMFDPPFLISPPNAPSIKNGIKKGSNMMFKRFSSYYPSSELWKFYAESIKEFYRVLAKDGILIVKCQDTVSSKKQYLSHVFIIKEAERLGFYCQDIFILIAKSRLISFKGGKQQHARKFHSYFLVFEKTNKIKINYIV